MFKVKIYNKITIKLGYYIYTYNWNDKAHNIGGLEITRNIIIRLACFAYVQDIESKKKKIIIICASYKWAYHIWTSH